LLDSLTGRDHVRGNGLGTVVRGKLARGKSTRNRLTPPNEASDIGLVVGVVE